MMVRRIDMNVIVQARYNLYYLMQYPDRINGSRLTIGPLLREILLRIDQAGSVPRFSLYSGYVELN